MATPKFIATNLLKEKKNQKNVKSFIFFNTVHPREMKFKLGKVEIPIF